VVVFDDTQQQRRLYVISLILRAVRVSLGLGLAATERGVPLRLSDFNEEFIRYVVWYNEHRPHQYLHGRTPNEVYDCRFPARDDPRLEPRTKYPLKARNGNHASTLVHRATNLQVVVTHLDNRRHLPLVSIKQAA
jgi:hypothetical protein